MTVATRVRYTPTLEEARAVARPGLLIPIYRTITADLETPVSAYLKLARGGTGPSFLLESVEGSEQVARYSFLGTEPALAIDLPTEGGYVERRNGEFAHHPGPPADPLALMQPHLTREVASVPGLPRFHGGFVGFLGYEVAGRFEHLPAPRPDSLGLPDAALGRFDDIAVFDHVLHQLKIVSHIAVDDPNDLEHAYEAAVARIDGLAQRLRQPLGPTFVGAQHAAPSKATQPAGWANISREEYEEVVRRARRYIVQGEVIQVVPSRRTARPTHADPFAIYRTLRTVNPSPFMFFLDFGDYQLIGASPELLVKVEDGVVTTHPIAGTRRRGATPDEDRALEEELRNDEKERAEHLMLVDLGRNDVGRVSEPGSVRVTQFMGVERYSHVMHLVSRVEGRLRGDLTAFDALRACFPAGTVSGAPKIRAMEIINELEPDRRGPYAGAVGVFGYGGGLEVAITIRTITLRAGVAYVQSGGGVVFDSQPDKEYEETVSKAQAMLRAIDIAEEGDL